MEGILAVVGGEESGMPTAAAEATGPGDPWRWHQSWRHPPVGRRRKGDESIHPSIKTSKPREFLCSYSSFSLFSSSSSSLSIGKCCLSFDSLRTKRKKKKTVDDITKCQQLTTTRWEYQKKDGKRPLFLIIIRIDPSWIYSLPSEIRAGLPF